MASAESGESKPAGEEGAAANPEHINLKVLLRRNLVKILMQDRWPSQSTRWWVRTAILFSSRSRSILHWRNWCLPTARGLGLLFRLPFMRFLILLQYICINFAFLCFVKWQGMISDDSITRPSGSHLTAPGSMRATHQRALTWRWETYLEKDIWILIQNSSWISCNKFQDGDTIEVFQQQSGGGWGGREGDLLPLIPFYILTSRLFDILRCSVETPHRPLLIIVITKTFCKWL